ncbi:MAG: nucleotidyltransferase family protein [Candidatus Cyclobacteriaceae bacterium M2_1C_046]
METNFSDHLIERDKLIHKALEQLNKLAKDAILFVVDERNKLIGSLTDGDVRRGLLKGLTTDDKVEEFIQPNPKYILKKSYCIDEVISLRENNFKIIPVLNEGHEIINLINFRFLKSYLPVDAIIMAGGKGTRLRPLTENTPKPLLQIGEKPIIDYGIDHLKKYGVDDFWISLNYLGHQIQEHLGDGKERGISIKYIYENKPLGTIGAVSKIQAFQHDYVLITNSDLLTTIDYEDFFLDFLKKEADMAVVTIPYDVDIPYAVLETSGDNILSFTEKPTYTYYSNGGIYLIRSELLKQIPNESFYNSTDLMQKFLEEGKKIISYPLRQYWLDIGKPKDYKKAQEDIKHLNF